MAGRGTILSDSSNLPGDLYVAQSAARVQNRKLRIVAPARLVDELDEDVAVVMFSQVDFRTGRLWNYDPSLSRRMQYVRWYFATCRIARA